MLTEEMSLLEEEIAATFYNITRDMFIEDLGFKGELWMDYGAERTRKFSRSLCMAYREPTYDGYSGDRAYHNLSHVSSCLNILDEVMPLMDERYIRHQSFQTALKRQIQMALIGHDAVYRVGTPRKPYEWATANEQLSGLMLFKFLTLDLDFPALYSSEMMDLIISTDHDPKRTRPIAAQIICDVDLDGLSSSWDKFEKNAISIREEYGCFSDDEYINGRICFVESMLSRQRIYYTLPYLKKEKIARDNLRQHLENLKKGNIA